MHSVTPFFLQHFEWLTLQMPNKLNVILKRSLFSLFCSCFQLLIIFVFHFIFVLSNTCCFPRGFLSSSCCILCLLLPAQLFSQAYDPHIEIIKYLREFVIVACLIIIDALVHISNARKSVMRKGLEFL